MDRIADELRSALVEWGIDADDDESLISSGRVDSMALFQLSCWIEDRIGRPIDPSTIDLANEWDSVRAIARFVVAHGAR